MAWREIRIGRTGTGTGNRDDDVTDGRKPSETSADGMGELCQASTVVGAAKGVGAAVQQTYESMVPDLAQGRALQAGCLL